MENLFGEFPLVKLLIAFAIVFILIVATFWLLRRFGGTRIGGASRGRQPRLAVIDAAAVDGRRRLVLIRRDNVEHLVMIGGPSDVVIEQNIVRAVPVAPARDAPGRPPGAPEPRAETPAAEPAPRPPRPTVGDDGWPGEPPLRPQRPEATWAGPAEPPLRPYRPAPPPEDARPPTAEPRPPRLEPSLRGGPTPRVDTARGEPPARGERREPSLRSPAPEAPPTAPAPAAAGDKPSEPATVTRPPPLAPDANLADMAQRLEAALRRPIRPTGERAADAGAKSAPTVEPSARPAPPSPAAATPAAPGNESGDKGDKENPRPAATPPRAAATESKPASPKSVLDSLEEEMASLLGRPAGKE
jgi:flagellar protein FliO/FliZ